MSDMFSAFTSFISDDPLMLTLCILIILLIIIFFIILFFGNNKNEKDKENKEIENTSSLLKSDLTSDNLKSTQEFSLQNEENISFDNKEQPIIKELTPSIDEENAPINIDEAMIIKNSRPNEEPVKIPNIDEIKEIDIDAINEHKDNNQLVLDTNLESSTNKTDNIFDNIEEETDNVQNVFHQKIEPPIKINENIKPTVELSKEPINIENKEENKEPKEELDDIELPKLSSETAKIDSTLSNLNGEIFKM